MRIKCALGVAVMAVASLVAIPVAGAQTSGSTLVIGVPYAGTGPNSGGTKALPGVVNAWVKYTNANGGVAGHKVKAVLGDTKTDPAAGQAVATKMVEQDHIIAAVGGSDDTSVVATTQYFASQKVPVIGGACYATSVCAGGVSPFSPNGGNPDFFTVTTTIPAVVWEQFAAAKSVAQVKKVGVMTCAESPSCASADPLYKAFAGAMGLEYEGLVTVAQADPSYTAPCLTMKQKGAEFVQISADASTGARIVADCAKQGYTPVFGASAGTVNGPTWLQVSKQNPKFVLVGGLNAFPWFVKDAPVKTFVNSMKKYSKGSIYESPTMTATWSSLELWKAAMNKAKASLPANPTSADVTSAMYGLQDEDLGGLLPQPMTYTQGKSGPDIPCYYYFKLTKGAFTAPSGGLKPDCMPTS